MTPKLEVTYLPLDGLIPYAANARTHSEEQVAQIAASIREFGFTNPVLIDEQGGIIAGHGRVMAARVLKLPEVPCITLRGLSPAQRRAYVIADNKLALNAGWDEAMLTAELQRLEEDGYNIDLTGFSADEVTALVDQYGLRGVNVVRGNDPDDPQVGSTDLQVGVLRLLDVTIQEPKQATLAGEVWQVGPHLLVVCGVIDQHEIWTPLLLPGTLFCPYPGVFVPFSKKARDCVLVMVQPDPYIAGHIIDRYREANGEASVYKIERAPQ